MRTVSASFVLLSALLSGCSPAPEEEVTSEPSAVAASYVGSQACAQCHRGESAAWQGSHHQLAMAEPGAESTKGDFADVTFGQSSFSTSDHAFTVRTDGADGDLADFTVRYTFGVEPLQQYLLELPGGRLQALGIAWDARASAAGGQRWFHLQPDAPFDHQDVLHWTRDGQNWNYMCADCHSTAVEKRYDDQSRTYDTTFAEVSVGCEACHGPGSLHANDPGATGLPVLSQQSEQLNVCAPCHSRRAQLAEGFLPSRPYLDHYLPALLDAGLYHPDGQILDEVYVYGSFLQSKMHSQGVSCTDCHEPHAATLRLGGDGVCTQCHNPAGRPEYPTLQSARYDAGSHHFHEPASPGARCVNCHMPTRTYMGVDDRRDHGFRVPRPDLTSTLGVPNACNACHQDRSPEWAADVIAERVGEARPEHFASVFAGARVLDPGAEAGLANIANDASQSPIVRATALSLMVGYERGMTTFALESGLRDADPLVRIGAL